MVIPHYANLSIRKQCKALGLNRSSYYQEFPGESLETLSLMKQIDRLYLSYPSYGSRRIKQVLTHEGNKVGRHRIRRLMRLMGLQALYQKPRTSVGNPDHKIYPYLLRTLTIERPNQVWCSDITYVPMKRGFMYLTAIMDWYSRKVLSWRLSNTLDVSFCIQALIEALESYGRPEIFNTDQGAQYTSREFTEILKTHDIKISMDSKGRWMDNVMIERLWRSVKYECLYLQEFDSIKELRETLKGWFIFYNEKRPHATFGGRRPREVYEGLLTENAA